MKDPGSLATLPGSHRTHSRAPALLALPNWQARQLLKPVALAKRPAEQGSQTLCAGSGPEKYPRSQALQLLQPVRANLPAGQALQFADPSVPVKVPGKQGTHSPCVLRL